MKKERFILATRGSALALAQTNLVLAQCRQAFPQWEFEIKIIKTTGDKLQTASMANPDASSAKGLFTKELETALLRHEADLAVHSLKDLPTDLPAGLRLGAVCQRADVRDVLIYRGSDSAVSSAEEPGIESENKSGHRAGKRTFGVGLTVMGLPNGAVIATSSTRRQAQLSALRPDLKMVPIRGNVGTRLQKLAQQADIDALILAAAGLARLHFEISSQGKLLFPTGAEPLSSPGAKGQRQGAGTQPPPYLLANRLSVEEMLPCVGQGAIGIEVRDKDERMAPVCAHLNHEPTWQCVLAERAFLHTMGGGCQSPVAAYAEISGEELRLRAVSFRDGPARRAEVSGPAVNAIKLGAAVAQRLTGHPEALARG